MLWRLVLRAYDGRIYQTAPSIMTSVCEEMAIHDDGKGEKKQEYGYTK